MKKLARALAAIQLSILVLWIVFFPLHLVFELDDAGQNSFSRISHHENSCCGKSHVTSRDSQTPINLHNFRPASLCSICDFAVQLAASDLADSFVFQFFATVTSSSLQPCAAITVAAFSFYNSRAPPSELIA
ncbi:MAG: hypothetical protein A2W80_05990 [Candidatus Riflebacteria bacterium GWC2_50_8]|nr:MAG: hypothetical protein A2W80_05990 [Candidatus Riflebacteria bacterium GWC2_50_8]